MITMVDPLAIAPHLPGLWHDQAQDGLRGMPVRCENDEQVEAWLRIYADSQTARALRDRVLIFARTDWEARYWMHEVGGIRPLHTLAITHWHHIRGVSRTRFMPRVFLDGFWDNPYAPSIIRDFNVGEISK